VPTASPAYDTSFLVEDEHRLRRVLETAQSVAVVGLSSDPGRPSNSVARTLLRYGFDVIPINPHESEVLGIRAYPDLLSVKRPIDVVDVFRRSLEVGPHADEAIAIGAKVLWLQQGVIDPGAARRAHAAGLQVVMDRCMARELSALGIAPKR